MNAFCVELRKALINPWFTTALAVGCTLAITSIAGNIALYDETLSYVLPTVSFSDPETSSMSLFRFLLFTDFIQPSTDLFYALLPLLAVLPYSWSLAQEQRRGYLQNVCQRTTRARCFTCKASAAFVAGALVVAVPLLINLLIGLCFIPTYTTSIATVIYTGIYDTNLWSSLYYLNPPAYCTLFIVLNAGFSGLWAAFVLLIGLFFADSTRLLAGSFIALYLYQAFEYQIAVTFTGSALGYLSFSPLSFLRGVAVSGNTNEWSFIPWFAVLAIISALIIVRGKEDLL